MELRKLNNMQKEIYLDYIENLVDISKLTTKENSIMFNFKIDNDGKLTISWSIIPTVEKPVRIILIGKN